MKFDHLAINVYNIQESIDWYLGHLGGEILYQDETWGLISVGGMKLAFTLEEQHPPHLCFEIEDKDKESLTVKYGDFGWHRDGSEYLYVKDNSGNTVEFLMWPKIKNVT